MWVSSGKSSHRQFTPSLIDPTPVQVAEAAEGQNQVLTVELHGRLFPACGLIKTNITGEIRAPAVHFDLPFAMDLWVFALRSSCFPLKIGVAKSPLTIANGSAEALAQLEVGSSNFGGSESSLKAYLSMHGEGFKRVTLSLQRSIDGVSVEQVVGEITDGIETYAWTPSISSFDVVLVASSNIYLSQFLGFLRYLGAETKESIFALGNFLPTNFLLCDGPAINYTMRLLGEKGLLGLHEKDQTHITLNP
jgi:hypothetical protein